MTGIPISESTRTNCSIIGNLQNTLVNGKKKQQCVASYLFICYMSSFFSKVLVNLLLFILLLLLMLPIFTCENLVMSFRSVHVDSKLDLLCVNVEFV